MNEDAMASVVYLCMASAEQPPNVFLDWIRLASPEERVRASRFRHDCDRKRFLVGRGILRVLLSTYVGVAPADLEFRTTRFGKPLLIHRAARRRAFFSLSRSNDRVLIAITSDREVGVDLERVRALPDASDICSFCFSPVELETVRGAAHHVVPDEFFRIWTRKEAFAKACGYGLSLELDQYDVSGQQVRSLKDQRGTESVWTVVDLRPGSPYAASLCVQSTVIPHLVWVTPHGVTALNSSASKVAQ